MKRLLSCLILMLVAGCTQYYKCPLCSAAYRQRWCETGLPGQFRYECKLCGGELRSCGKEESGWDDQLPPTIK